MTSFQESVQTTLETSKSFVAKKFSEAAQAYPELKDYYDMTLSTATQVYANRPSVDEVFTATFTTISQKAPWLTQQVESHLANFPNKVTLTEVDKVAVLVILAISALAVVIVGIWLVKKFLSFLLCCVFGTRAESASVPTETVAKAPKAARKSVSPKRASRKKVDSAVEEEDTEETVEPEAEVEKETVPKSAARRTSTKTPRMRTPSRNDATVAAEPATVEAATPAPAKVLDFGVTPKQGAGLEEISNKVMEEATPRRSARLAAIGEKGQPMPAVEETEPVTLPAENPSFEWDKLTVPDLKAELKRRGEKVGQARKAELVERLQTLDKENARVQ
jgi:hypothetical protein